MKPLACSIAMHHGETLRSYLGRLARLNVYDSSSWIVGAIPKEIEAYGDEWFESLSVLTSVSSIDLQSAYMREFGPLWSRLQDHLITSNEVVESAFWDMKRIATHLRSKRSCSYCPLCLQEATYERSSWVSKHSIYCMKHQVALIERCPGCHSRVTLSSLIADCCAKCGTFFSQRTSDPCPIGPANIGAQTLLDRWWSGSRELLPEAHDLPSAPDDVLYLVFAGLVRVVAKDILRVSQMVLFNINSQESASAAPCTLGPLPLSQATAFGALCQWPESFYTFLDHLRRRHGRAFGHYVVQDFGWLYRNYLEGEWLFEDFEFVQRAFEEFLYKHYQYRRELELIRRYAEDPSFRERFQYISTYEAAERLGIHRREVENLIRQRAFLCEFPHKSPLGSVRWLHAFAVDYWAEESLKRETTASAARSIGVPEESIPELIDAGLLTGEMMPSGELLVDGRSILQFQVTYRKAMVRLDGPPIPFDQALSLLEPFGWDHTRLVQAIIRQEIRGTGGGPGVYATSVHKSDVEMIRSGILKKRFLEPSAAATAAIFGVDPSFIPIWHRLGLIPRHHDNGKRLYDMTDSEVAEFRHKFVFFREAVDLLGIPAGTFYHYLTSGIVRYVAQEMKGVRTGLFYRSDIEELAASRKRYTVSAVEVKSC